MDKAFLDGLSNKELILFLRERLDLGDKIINELKSERFIYKIQILIDAYGLYLGARKFWKTRSGREDPEAILKIVQLSLHEIKTHFEHLMPTLYPNYIYQYLIFGECFENHDEDKVRQNLKKYEKMSCIEFDFQWFFAQDSNKKFQNRLLRYSDTINDYNQNDEKNFIERKIKELREYPEFVKKMNRNRYFSGSLKEGYLQTNLTNKGKVSMSEKETDINIAVEAMDSFYKKEVHKLIIISSDTDFNPLIQKFKDSSIKMLQIPLGKLIAGEEFSVREKNYYSMSDVKFKFDMFEVMKNFYDTSYYNYNHRFMKNLIIK